MTLEAHKETECMTASQALQTMSNTGINANQAIGATPFAKSNFVKSVDTSNNSGWPHACPSKDATARCHSNFHLAAKKQLLGRLFSAPPR